MLTTIIFLSTKLQPQKMNRARQKPILVTYFPIPVLEWPNFYSKSGLGVLRDGNDSCNSPLLCYNRFRLFRLARTSANYTGPVVRLKCGFEQIL